jgi:ubiquinone/menaquinone biosynthesis C-methylase UbiE
VSSEDGLIQANVDAYRRYTERVLGGESDPEAMALAIGASSVEEFHRTGQYEADLLIQSGLLPNSFLVDVGCGSGRLASKLAPSHEGRYLGTEISSELLDYASRISNRPDWRFESVHGLSIPIDDGMADMVCFFSVLTHLRNEESYLYLEEARRVLKPGGRIVFSFLDFSQVPHRTVFEVTVAALRASLDRQVNEFISKDAIALWADMLQVDVVALHDGTTSYITASDSPYRPPDIRQVTLGQSACVLQKPR